MYLLCPRFSLMRTVQESWRTPRAASSTSGRICRPQPEQHTGGILEQRKPTVITAESDTRANNHTPKFDDPIQCCFEIVYGHIHAGTR